MKCRGCGKEIRFLKTAHGRVIPVDVETVLEEDVDFDPVRHVTHFATCPKAEEFRRGKHGSGERLPDGGVGQGTGRAEDERDPL